MKSALGLSASVPFVLSAAPISGRQLLLHPRHEPPVIYGGLMAHPTPISGNTVVVGTPHHGTGGAARVYEKTVADWSCSTGIVPNRPIIRGGSS